MSRPLGTILPTAASLALGDAFAASLEAEQKKIGAMITGCRKALVGGEVRYYKSSIRYAVVSRWMLIIWFDVRADGDYPVRK